MRSGRVGGLAIVVSAVVVVFVLVGCGDGGGSGADPESRAPETSIEKDDQAFAERFVLRLSDFPAGWRATSSEDEPDESIFDVCTNVDFSGLVVTGRAESDDFAASGGAEATSVGGLFETSAEPAFEQYATDETMNCLRDLVEEELAGEDAEIGEISVGALSFPAVGARSRAYQIVIEVKTGGASPTGEDVVLHAYFDFVFVQSDRALAVLLFMDVLTPFDTNLKVELAQTVAARMSGEDESAGTPPAETDADAADSKTLALGEKVYGSSGCGGCHTLAAFGSSGEVGPDLDDLRPDAATVAGQVRNGSDVMPSFGGHLSDEEIRAVAEYVASAADS